MEKELTINADEGGGQSNRLFLLISLAMIGLICIGLMGLGAVIFVTSTNRAQEAVAASPTPPPPVLPTFTSTPIPSPTPTETPLPTPTGTPVISENFGEEPPAESPEGAEEVDQEGGQPEEASEEEEPTSEPEEMPAEGEPTSEPDVTPTNTLVLQSPTVTPTETPAAATPVAGMPGSGAVLPVRSGGFLVWAGVGLLALLLVAAVRRFR